MAGDGKPLVIQVGFGEVTTGLWCPHCLKPSGYTVGICGLQESGVYQLGRLSKCDDCEAPLCDSD